jgi:hypothetical protein
MRVLGADLCEEHASEIEAKLCERDDCLRCAAVVIALDGHDHATGAPRHDELRVCDQCWEALQAAPSITLNGITMVHDGNLRMKVLPPSIGQG